LDLFTDLGMVCRERNHIPLVLLTSIRQAIGLVLCTRQIPFGSAQQVLVGGYSKLDALRQYSLSVARPGAARVLPIPIGVK